MELCCGANVGAVYTTKLSLTTISEVVVLRSGPRDNYKQVLAGKRNMRKATASSILVAGALLQMGCSTHTFQVKYEPTREVLPAADSTPLTSIGTIRDDRGTESTWLGAIRGGYGNPLKKLYSDQPITSVVTTALSDALQARKLLAPANGAAVRLDGSVAKLDCSYYFNREAHAHLLLDVVDLKTNATLFSQTYKTDTKESGVGAGIFGDVDHLAAFMQKTLNETIDKALADPALLNALTTVRSSSL